MRGHRVGELAVEIVDADGVELCGDFVRQRGFHECERAARVVDDVRIGDAPPEIAGSVGVVERRIRKIEALGAHPAVAIPSGTAVFEPYAVHHSVAGEPMRAVLARVRPVAQVPAVEFRRQRAGDRQVESGEFVVDRGVMALEVEIGGGHGITRPSGRGPGRCADSEW